MLIPIDGEMIYITMKISQKFVHNINKMTRRHILYFSLGQL